MISRQAERDALRVASACVAGIAAVHAVLHANLKQHDIVPKLDLGSYPRNLCVALRGAFDVDGEHRVLCVVTELVSNALRHAFEPTKSGAVRVNGNYCSYGWYELSIEDNGRGLPRDFDFRLRLTGLGLRMVNMLTDMVGARLTASGRMGANFVLTLPVQHRDRDGIGRLAARR